MATQTTNYSLYKPTVNGDENVWGTYWNYNADRLDVELNTLQGSIDGVAGTAAATNVTVSDLSGTVTTIANQVSALQQDDTAQDTSITALTDRVSSAELKITTLQAGGGGGGSGAALTNGSVVTAYIADNAITAVKLAVDSVTNTAIETAAVNTDSIANDAIVNRHLSDDCITRSEIKEDEVLSVHIADQQVSTEHITSTHVLAPKPGASDIDKVLYNDEHDGLKWKRSNKVTTLQKYTDLFANTGDVDPGDLFVIANAGTAGGSGANDYPTSIGGEATPVSLDASSVFLANRSAPSNVSHYTTLYTGSNGVTNVNTTNPVVAVFELADGTSYNVPLPQFSINSENTIAGANCAANDYLAVYDRSASQQKKVELQELGQAMGWGSVVIEGGGGADGLINTFGIITGFEVDTASGSLLMNSTGGFTSQTANIDSNGDFLLTG